jgi:hypothetical protein
MRYAFVTTVDGALAAVTHQTAWFACVDRKWAFERTTNTYIKVDVAHFTCGARSTLSVYEALVVLTALAKVRLLLVIPEA